MYFASLRVAFVDEAGGKKFRTVQEWRSRWAMSPAQPEDLGFRMIDQDHIYPTTAVSTMQPLAVSKSSPSRLPYNDNAVAGLVFR